MTWFGWSLIIGYILLSLSLYKLFAKAGEDPKKGLIPGYNFAVWARLIGRKPSWAALLLIPIVNIFIFAGMAVDLARSFGRYSFTDSVLAVVFAPFYFGWLGLSDEQYEGPILERERAYKAEIEEARAKGSQRKVQQLESRNPYRKGPIREWAEAIIFAVFAAAFIRMFLIEAYVIPTPSMEGSLLVGDFLFVSKAHYGMRMPQTVAMLPLLHNRAPVVDAESYWEKPSLPYRRLPALESIDRNDPIVFNLPSGDSVYVFPDRTWTAQDLRYGMIEEANPAYFRAIQSGRKELITRPMDKKDHYIKRAIGLPGDTLQIIDRQVYIDGQAVDNPTHLQYLYRVTPTQALNIERLTDWGIGQGDVMQGFEPNEFLMFLSQEQIGQLKGTDAGISIEPIDWEHPRLPQNPRRLFPHDPANYSGWTVDNFGPVYIPRAGATIPISPENIAMYERIINVYEDNDLDVRNGQVYINGEAADSYTFKQDYYWAMGDNRHNSEDSRVWGHVPADHIVGKPLFIWFSLKDGSLANGINWSRLFTGADKR